MPLKTVEAGDAVYPVPVTHVLTGLKPSATLAESWFNPMLAFLTVVSSFWMSARFARTASSVIRLQVRLRCQVPVPESGVRLRCQVPVPEFGVRPQGQHAS